MMKRILLASVSVLWLASPAAAQNIMCSNRPAGDSTNACANTRFVQSSGGSIVSNTLDWYVVGSDAYPTLASARAAVVANKGGVIFFPCGTYSLDASAKGLDLDDLDFPIRITGDGAPFGGPANKCVNIFYATSGGTAISARSTRSIEIDHIQLYLAGNTVGIDFSHSLTGSDTDVPYVHDNTILHLAANANNIGISISDTQNGILRRNSIATNGGRAIRGVAPGRQFSTKTQVLENIFGQGNAIAVSSAGSDWTIAGNTVQGSVQRFYESGPASSCTVLNIIGNWVGDYFSGGITLIDSNCTSLVSIGNEYANGSGGTGINIQQANSTGNVTSIGDKHDGTTAIAIGTGNTLYYPTFARGSAGTAVTGTPSQTLTTNGILYSNGYGVPPSSTAANAAMITWLGTSSSANLRGALTDETGNGLAFFQNGDLGAATGTSLATTSFLSTATKLRAIGTAPALTSCGTSPVIEGSDLSGTITMGTGSPTACTLTFNVTYASAPRCTVSWRNNLAAMNYSTTAGTLVLGQTATSSNLVDYICTARTGG